jgi:hypothetical protein
MMYSGAREDLQRLLTESLKRVRRRARLVCAAAHELSAGALDLLGNGAGLIERLDRARSADHDNTVAADVHAADVDDRVIGLRLAADQFVGMGDGNDFLDAGEVLEDRRISCAAMPGHPDRGAECARNRVCAKPHPFDVPDDGFDLIRPRRGLHDDEHDDLSWS